MSSEANRTMPEEDSVLYGPDVPHVGMRIGGRYQLLARRGRGGIGEVWEARVADTDRRVAIKLLLPGWQTDQNIRKRFIREGRLASTMEHRHIVDIFEVGESRTGMPFIVMELLHGPPLDRVMQEEGPLPWARVKRILLQVCGALDHAHSLKIVHRDVKPSNIMLANEPAQPDRCKLVDFGIAKQSLVHLHTQALTGEGQMLGSPGFMSPEQLRGRPTGIPSDIYGLGCTGFYLMTGRVPFPGRSLPEMIHNALYEAPRPLDDIDLDDSLRRDVEAILHRAIHRDPLMRFGSVLDFVVALNHVGATQLPQWSSPRTSPQRRPEPGAATVDVPPPVAEPEPPSEPRRRRASEVPTQTLSPATPPPPRETELIPSSVTPRGMISRRSHGQVLNGRSTAELISWAGPEGFIDLARVPPDIIVVQMSGQVGPAAAWLFEQQLGPLLQRHRPSHLFWHLGELVGFPSEVRDACLHSLTEHRRGIASVHVLNGPGLVGMSVSLATVALGGKPRVYEDQLAWRGALDAWAFGRRD